MSQPLESTRTKVLNKFVEYRNAVSHDIDTSLPFLGECLSINQSDVDNPAQLNFFSRPKKIGNKLSLSKWSSWHTKNSEYFDDLRSQPANEINSIKELMPLVKMIAQKIHRSLPANIMLNDLVQDGMIGMLMAFNEHDAELGVSLKSFAECKIKWAIMDGLRTGDWAGRTVRRRAGKVAKTTEKLQAILHREPLKSEIAEALDVSVNEVASTLGDAYGYNFIRINDSVDGELQDIPDLCLEPSVIAERRQEYYRVVSSLRSLPANERRAFILRTLCDMNGQQTATEMGVSESRVSQLCKMATVKLSSNVACWTPHQQ